ncbi:hypothetical protein MHYP_G00054300 [Metynnis hypsauchen]
MGCEVMSAANTEAEASGLNMQTHLDEPVPPNDPPLAEIKPLKNDSPGNEAKTNQQKKKTRRGTRGKGRKINYKKGPRREE